MRDNMAKMTKSEARRLVQAINSKAFKLISRPPSGMNTTVFTIKDFEAIQRIVERAYKRMK